jgi:hypothetical protein
VGTGRNLSPPVRGPGFRFYRGYLLLGLEFHCSAFVILSEAQDLNRAMFKEQNRSWIMRSRTEA